ncbi:hypothetical protein [Cesiribacter sp. SM1]|uniref:hypothetical protein n=1 Tax=Cesiribacter sp. SM1 TaxID=2861196 RepID=UPI001CD61F65|nr:hypothetical protein [Cesiribacter sp. SM1]
MKNHPSPLQELQNAISPVTYIFILTITGVMLCACTQKPEKEQVLLLGEVPVLGDMPQCGTVQFSDGCGERTDTLISYGLALVHHMTYTEAESIFDQVIAENPECFWGHWGKALTFIHPVWPDTPSEEQLKMGWELTQTALSLATKEKEKAYGKALTAFYEGEPARTKLERLKSYEQSWATAFENYPDDTEIKTFYALSLIATADPGDKTYKNQVKAGKLAEEVLQVIPDHPGGFHYAIHAYDNPVLGKKAIDVANNYGKIAPEIPHALHMPTHIFTRQGMWKESIDWNRRSAKAALANPFQGNVSMHYFHALDYMVYSHLQRGEDKKARRIVDEYKKLNQPIQQHFITAYALAAMESRYYMERQAWEEAAKLEVWRHQYFPWEQFPESEALVYFTKVIGAARSGQPEVAVAAIQKLEKLQQATSNPYWAKQIDIQKNTVKAWLAYARGNKKEALATMKSAAALESSTEKHAVTPGELLPAVELLGDMLLALNQPAEALLQYEVALQRSPGRLNSIYGAAHAAELSGDKQKANQYYTSLMNLSADAEILLDQRKVALAYLEKN